MWEESKGKRGGTLKEHRKNKRIVNLSRDKKWILIKHVVLEDRKIQHEKIKSLQILQGEKKIFNIQDVGGQYFGFTPSMDHVILAKILPNSFNKLGSRYLSTY